MYENNNKSIINKLAKCSIRSNRMRNAFAIIAIILTTVLFTTIFTIGASMLKSVEYSIMRQVGTSSHGGFKYLITEEYEILKEHKDIKEYGITIPVAMVENPELAKRRVEINYIDENEAKYRFIVPLLKGNMPKNEDEIVLDTITLDMLGIKHELGQNIKLDYSIDDEGYSKEFTLTGYYQGDTVSMASSACISKEFIENNISHVDQMVSRDMGLYTGTINLGVMLNNKYTIEKKLLNILYDNEFDLNGTSYGVNWAYMGNDLSMELTEIIPLIGLLLLIGLSGYLIIYNIFYLSIIKDTRFYGLLKTIGTTSKQLKKMILKQAMIFSLIGIPIGLAIGYLVGVILLPYVMQILTITHTTISINPTIFICSALFSIGTVLISCNKPAKIAATTSPIEAIRYTGIALDKKKKIKIKKSSNGAKLYKMAFSNIFRNKKKAFIVIISLAISMILLNTVYTMVSGFDIDKFLEGQVGADFSIGDASFYRWRFEESNPNAVTEELCQEIEELTGVEKIGKLYNRELEIPITKEMKTLLEDSMQALDTENDYNYENIIVRNQLAIDLYGMDNILFPILNEHVVEGEIDNELFKTGDYAVVTRRTWDIDIYNVGDKIVLSSGNGNNKEYSIMAVVENLPLYLYSGKFIRGTINIYIPSQEYRGYTDDMSIMTALFNVEEEEISNVENYIKDKIKEVPLLDYRSKEVYVQEFNKMVDTFNSVGYTLSLIIALIGILNFTNVIITSIISRRQEFATIQSIGMTSKQLKKMLVFEGLNYALISGMVVILMGLPITYIGVNGLAGQMGLFSYHFTIFPIIVCMPILIVIAFIVPILAFGNIKNVSVVERLREIE